jgi:pectin methylesterase-like acyl-CoA thioesterase
MLLALEDRSLPGDSLLGIVLAHGLMPRHDQPTRGDLGSGPAHTAMVDLYPTDDNQSLTTARAPATPAVEEMGRLPGNSDPSLSAVDRTPEPAGDVLFPADAGALEFAPDPFAAPASMTAARTEPSEAMLPEASNLAGRAIDGGASVTAPASGGMISAASPVVVTAAMSANAGLATSFNLVLPQGPPPPRHFGVASFAPGNGARGVCIDTPLSVTFNQEPHLGTSGTIGIHRADGSLADQIDLADPSSFKRYIGGAAAGGVPYAFNYYPVIITGNTATIYLHQTLDYGQTYYVTMDRGVILDASGNPFPGFSDRDTWRFQTKATGPADRTTRLTVAGDNSGDFCTVQGAIDFVPVNNTQRVVINVRPGVYNEIVYVRSSKPFITVDGGDRDQTIIQYPNNNNFNGAVSGNFRAMFGVDAPDFILANITLHNTTPHGGSQAEAFRGNNQRILLNHVNLISFQDTLLLQGKGFVNDSYIEGDVDFMWGYGSVFFQNCELKAVTSNGYYTQIRNGQGVNGDVFVNCRLTRADASISGSYLSRIDPTVFPYSQVVYINTAMGPHIRPVGWLLNNATEAPNVQFWEYHSTDLNGAPLDVSQRASFSRQLSDAEAAQWSDPAFVLGGWVPDLTPPTFNSLTATPDVLEHPHDQFVPVTLHADVSDPGDPAPETRIIGVTSDQPSHHDVDWKITGDLTLKLRAERGPHQSARVYTITVESRDFSGNQSVATVTVTVPGRQ